LGTISADTRKPRKSAINSTGLNVSITTSRQILCTVGNMSSFRKKNNKNPNELETDGNRLPQPQEVAETFAAYCINSVFNNHDMRDFFTDSKSSNSVPTASVCDSDALKDVRRLRPSKSVGFDDT
jgi:hypothetical protein